MLLMAAMQPGRGCLAFPFHAQLTPLTVQLSPFAIALEALFHDQDKLGSRPALPLDAAVLLMQVGPRALIFCHLAKAFCLEMVAAWLALTFCGYARRVGNHNCAC